ncbi:DUF4038 domain-containing protein [Dactylosporangium sp. CA-233914]|uniref:apiosidase-like domain-containing protein n=1 Tax=Dactylosporangium sp. CA-233914 TaxID=3239934 RepID=UPI003D8B0399
MVGFNIPAAAAGSGPAGAAQSASQGPTLSAETWRAVEVALHSTVSYADPYRDVDVTATFSGPNGQRLTMPGFWDGANTWRVRFAPPTPGRWQYTTRSTDATNTGLDDHHGTILAHRYAGDLAIYRHGFLRTSPNGRYMTYADGTPFFWLGDNQQSNLTGQTRLYESNDARFSSMFKGIVDTRVGQGFNVIWNETFANNGGNVNEGGPVWFGGTFHTLNPQFWDNVDERIGYIASKGVVDALTMGVGSSLTDANKDQLPEYKRLARYLVARYAAYPMVWLTAQEFDQPGNCAQCWVQVAQVFADADPYRQPASLHNYPIYAGGGVEPRDQPWYGFVALQEGHNRVDSVADYWLKQYQQTPTRPVVEAEANYEGIDVFWDNHAIVQNWQTRESAWKARVGGVAGNNYGAAGVWWACWTAQDPDWNCLNFGSTPWNEGLFLPGAEQMGYLKSFFTSLPWWRLAPAPTVITWADTAPTDSQLAFASTTADHSHTVVYYPHRLDGGQPYTGTLTDLPHGQYSMKWFNPRTGGYAAAGSFKVTGAQGTAQLPPEPSATDDWALLISRAAR